MTMTYRANFGDGTTTRAYADIRDAKLAIWGRAAIVQYRSSVESYVNSQWVTVCPSRAERNGPAIVSVDRA
jgi:hypothetical protein